MDISRQCQPEKLIPLLPWPGFDPSFSGHNDRRAIISKWTWLRLRPLSHRGWQCSSFGTYDVHKVVPIRVLITEKFNYFMTSLWHDEVKTRRPKTSTLNIYLICFLDAQNHSSIAPSKSYLVIIYPQFTRKQHASWSCAQLHHPS